VSRDRKPASIEQWATIARELRLGMPGHKDEIDQWVRQRLGPAVIDQVDAAAADPRHSLLADAVRRAEGDAAREFRIGAGTSPGATWVLDRVGGLFLRELAGVGDGTTLTCPHIRPDAPIACLMAPGTRVMACYRCARSMPEPAGREKYTCDVCRRYEPGLVMRETLIRRGPVTMMLGICLACFAKAEGTAVMT
jgi:hypothetical protein